MGKNKLKRFSELESLQRVFQPGFEEYFEKDYHLKGKWSSEVFQNKNPVVLELGCGRGEYTVSLAEMFPKMNFIGVDIKGARMWRGAKTAHENEIRNAAFLRSRIEFIESFFSAGEIEEIWITFPDPQLKQRRSKKRLTSPMFLNRYRHLLRDRGVVHLKTDNDDLFRYTLENALFNELEIVAETTDLYHSSLLNEILSIKTTYEKQFLSAGSNINYISFRLPSEKVITESVTDE